MGCVNIAESEDGQIMKKSRMKMLFEDLCEIIMKYYFVAIASVSSFCAGCFLTWSSAGVPLLQQNDNQIQITPYQGSWVASLVLAGAFFGAMMAEKISIKLGPKIVLQIANVVLIVAWLLVGFSGTIYGIQFGRFLGGISVGLISEITPRYVTEIANSKTRETTTQLCSLQIAVGAVFEYVIGVSENYIIITCVSCAIVSLHLLFLSFLPESPLHTFRTTINHNPKHNQDREHNQEPSFEDEEQKILRISECEDIQIDNQFENQVQNHLNNINNQINQIMDNHEDIPNQNCPFHGRNNQTDNLNNQNSDNINQDIQIHNQYNRDSNQYIQNSNQFSQDTNPLNQNSNKYIQDSNQFSQNSSQCNQDVNHLNQNSNQYHQFSQDENHLSQNANHLNEESNQYNQDSNQYAQNPNQYNQDTNQYNQDTNQYIQDSNQYTQNLNRYNQDSNQFSQNTNQYTQHSNQHTQDENRLSPNYNQLVKNHSKTLKILETLQHSNPTTELIRIHEKYEDSKNLPKFTRQDLKLALKDKGISRAFAIGAILMFFQQLTGTTAILFYAVKIFTKTGAVFKPHVCAVVLGFTYVLSSSISSLAAQRFSRRLLLLLSSACVCVCLCVLGVHLHLQATYDLSSYNYIPVICLTGAVFASTVGLGPLPFLIIDELFPPEMKKMTRKLAVGLHWLLAFAVTKTFRGVMDTIGPGWIFWNFGSSCFFATLFILFCVPETKSGNFRELQELLKGKHKKNKETGRNLEIKIEEITDEDNKCEFCK